MKTRQLTIHIILLMMTAIASSLTHGQTFRNNGTYNNTGTMTVNSYYNHKNSAPGTTNNTGTINATSLMDNNLALATINNNAGGTVNVTAAASDFNNGAGTTNNSTATSKVKVVNTLTLGSGSFSTSVGEVEYGSAGGQTIQSGVASGTYGKLTITGGGGTKSLNGTIVVADQVSLGAGTTFDVAGNQLTLNGATPFTGTGTFSASTVNSTVIYNAAGAQQIRGATYYNLTLQNGGTKTAQGGITIAGNGTLTNTVTLDMSANALTASAAGITITNSGATIRTQGNVDFGSNTFTLAGTFIYEASSGSQTIGAATYAALTLQNGTGASGEKIFPAATVSVTGAYSVSGGNRNYGGGTFAYTGTGPSAIQTVLSTESYNNLTITGASDTTFSVGGYKRANGNLAIGGALSIAAGNVLDMQNNAFTTLGSGSNLGKIMWATGNSHVVGGVGTTEFYSSGAGSITNGAYGILLLTGSGTKTLAGASTTATGVIVASTGNLTVSGTGDLTVNGDFDNSGSLTNSGQITVQ